MAPPPPGDLSSLYRGRWTAKRSENPRIGQVVLIYTKTTSKVSSQLSTLLRISHVPPLLLTDPSPPNSRRTRSQTPVSSCRPHAPTIRYRHPSSSLAATSFCPRPLLTNISTHACSDTTAIFHSVWNFTGTPFVVTCSHLLPFSAWAHPHGSQPPGVSLHVGSLHDSGAPGGHRHDLSLKQRCTTTISAGSSARDTAVAGACSSAPGVESTCKVLSELS